MLISLWQTVDVFDGEKKQPMHLRVLNPNVYRFPTNRDFDMPHDTLRINDHQRFANVGMIGVPQH